MKSALELMRELRRNEMEPISGAADPSNASPKTGDNQSEVDCQIRQNRQNRQNRQKQVPTHSSWLWSSAALDEEIQISPDGPGPVLDAPVSGRLIYNVAEVHALAGVTPQHLRLIHLAKRIFGGKIVCQDTTDEPLLLPLWGDDDNQAGSIPS